MAILIGLWVGGRIAYSLYAQYGVIVDHDPLITTNIARSFNPQHPIGNSRQVETLLPSKTDTVRSELAVRLSHLPNHRIVSISNSKIRPKLDFAAHTILQNKKLAIHEAGMTDLQPNLSQIPIQSQPGFENWPKISRMTAFDDVNPLLISSPSLKPTPSDGLISPRNFKLSGSTWMLWRKDRGQAVLASNGQLAGSQAGARLNLEFNSQAKLPKPFAFVRVTTPLATAKGKQGAVGLAARTGGPAPLEFALERRQRLDKAGRNAWALGMSGGFYELRINGQWRASGYAQAGVVGKRTRDIYVEGASEVTRPLSNKLDAGIGLWAANQPELHRADIGPLINWRIPIGGKAARLSGQWRFRIAGDAKPSSGPTITLGSDF